MRALIADDTALLRQGLARLLTEAGIEVCGEAGDGQELLQLVEQERPDVAIVDIRMPPTNSDEGLVAVVDVRRRSARLAQVLGAGADRLACTHMSRTATEVIPRIPEPVRKVVRNTIWASGRLTARWRELPDFLVIGAQKSGTTALYAYLRWHPAILGPFWKEVSFFDRHWAKGEAWYRGQLPLRADGKLVGEASPSYLFHPLAAKRVFSLVPDVRLVVLLREPGERAYSHYQHELALGRETLSFEDALAAEDERLRGEVERLCADPKAFSFAWWNHTYVSRSLYADQLEGWFELFPREQLLVLTTEDLGAQPAETYATVLSFLGAPPHALDAYPRVFDRDYAPMRDETREALTARFAEPNRRLGELLGRPLGWPTA